MAVSGQQHIMHFAQLCVNSTLEHLDRSYACSQAYPPASVTADATLEPASLTASVLDPFGLAAFWFAFESPESRALIACQQMDLAVLLAVGPQQASTNWDIHPFGASDSTGLLCAGHAVKRQAASFSLTLAPDDATCCSMHTHMLSHTVRRNSGFHALMRQEICSTKQQQGLNTTGKSLLNRQAIRDLKKVTACLLERYLPGLLAACAPSEAPFLAAPLPGVLSLLAILSPAASMLTQVNKCNKADLE